jgi:hypothetical protein
MRFCSTLFFEPRRLAVRGLMDAPKTHGPSHEKKCETYAATNCYTTRSTITMRAGWDSSPMFPDAQPTTSLRARLRLFPTWPTAEPSMPTAEPETEQVYSLSYR